VEPAEALGTYQTVVSAIERGVRGLTVQQVAKLASILGTSLDDILGPGRRPGNGTLKDRRFLRRFEKIERLSKRDKQVLLKNIDMFLKGAGVS
jgi:transcriptional regulator with XRE-family HTH domain